MNTYKHLLDNTIRSCCWFFIIVLLVGRSYGQSVRPDVARLPTYLETADSLYMHEEYNSLITLSKQVLPLTVDASLSTYRGQLYYYQALSYWHQRNLSKTLEILQKALVTSRHAGDVKTQAKAMFVASTIYVDWGNYRKAIAECLSNLDYFRKHRIIDEESYTYSVLYHIYRDLGDDRRTDFFLNKSVRTLGHVSTIGQIMVYSNIAQRFEDQGRYREAWPYRQKAISVADSMRTHRSIQISNLVSAAQNLRKQHRPKEAMHVLQRAVAVNGGLPDRILPGGQIYNEQALIHLEQGQYRKALQLAQLSLVKSRELPLPKTIAQALETLSLAQEKSGQYQQALQSHKAYHLIWDSLKTVENLAQVAKFQTLYELEKKEGTIRLLHKKAQFGILKTQQQEQTLKAAAREKKLYLMGIGVLICSVAIVGWFARRFFKAKQLLALKKAKIEAQAQKLEEINQLKDHLFSIVGHDLRGPVASLKASFMLLRMSDQIPDELIGLEQNVNGLSQTLDNLLYWSLGQKQGLLPQPRMIHLNELVEDVLESFTGLIVQKALKVTSDLEPEPVWADENMTVLVLRNILHNAIKFTNPGGEIHVDMAVGADRTRLRIVDTGIGMDPDSDQKLPIKGAGTGLGLSLSKDLMQRNGGQLTVESHPGRGTTITLSWLCTKVAEPANWLSDVVPVS